MNSIKTEKQYTIELSNMLSLELNKIHIKAGNLELLEVAENIIKNFCSQYYINGLNDASLVFAKCTEKFEEEVYVLEQNEKSKNS